MTMYYLIDENGMITKSANWKFDPNCLETDREILRGADGKLYFEDDPAYMPIPAPNPYVEEITWLKAYLADTDYVTNKIIESGLSLTEFLSANEKYVEVLEKREQTRQRINELEDPTDE